MESGVEPALDSGDFIFADDDFFVGEQSHRIVEQQPQDREPQHHTMDDPFQFHAANLQIIFELYPPNALKKLIFPWMRSK